MGSYIEPTKTTVAQFLDRWLDDVRTRVTPKTHERYTQLCHKNINPLLGATVLAKVKPEQISEAYAKALATGRRRGNGGLAPRTVRQMHAILKSALTQAVRWEILVRNPAAAVRGPKVNRVAMQTYDLEQTAELIEAARGRRVFIPILLAVLARRDRSPALAPRGSCGSATGGRSISRADKSRCQIQGPQEWLGRTIALSATLVAELAAHRVQQAEELLRLGKRVSEGDFVVTRPDGLPLRPHSLGQEWVRFLTGNGALPRIRFHDLRHAHATHLLSSGVHPKIASERLGHSKVGITLDLYSHVLPNMQADAAAIVDAALMAALNKRGAKG
jgi:integrase